LCIRRQIWWGHRIPAWYDDKGNVYVGRNESEVRKQHTLGDGITLTQDEDVLDTWFSSALWPFSTLGWPDETPELKTFYPTSVLITGFDIIFFWVARMIMMGLKFMGDVPFHEVYINGLVRDAHGQKMSKSKGNVLDPLDFIDGIELEALVYKRTSGLMQPQMARTIEKHTRNDFPEGIPAFGTDALRFTFAALASTGRDIKFDVNRIQGYRNYCNKLWNAARYVLMNTEDKDTGVSNEKTELTLADRWILSRLQQVEHTVNDAMAVYRFDLVASAIYEFTWHDYCDWYLELSKTVLMDNTSSEDLQRGTRRTLVRVLETLLRLAHPIIPFISEEIWQRVATLAGKQGETIMLQPYPEADESKINCTAIDDMEWLMTFILGVRSIRGEMNIAPGKPLPVLLSNWTQQERDRAEKHKNYLVTLARLENMTWLEASDKAPESATALAGNTSILIPLAGLIDKDAEITRLNKELEKLRKDHERGNTKLGNANFVDRAPAEIVDKERARVEELTSSIQKLEEQLARISAL